MFEVHGEKAFREGEKRVIARLMEGPPGVMATGGGAFMNTVTRERIKERGISIWLRADLDPTQQAEKHYCHKQHHCQNMA